MRPIRVASCLVAFLLGGCSGGDAPPAAPPADPPAQAASRPAAPAVAPAADTTAATTETATGPAADPPPRPADSLDEPLPPFDEMPEEPRVVAEGTFAAPHAGAFRIYEAPGGRLLRLEELAVADASALDLWLLAGSAPADRPLDAGWRIAPLRARSGNQNYLFEDTPELAGFTTLALVDTAGAIVAQTALKR